MELLETVIQALIEERVLDARHKDHALGGALAAYSECHILPDWLLIYRIERHQLVLTVSRTGTHSDLFGELSGAAGRVLPV